MALRADAPAFVPASFETPKPSTNTQHCLDNSFEHQVLGHKNERPQRKPRTKSRRRKKKGSGRGDDRQTCLPANHGTQKEQITQNRHVSSKTRNKDQRRRKRRSIENHAGGSGGKHDRHENSMTEDSALFPPLVSESAKKKPDTQMIRDWSIITESVVVVKEEPQQESPTSLLPTVSGSVSLTPLVRRSKPETPTVTLQTPIVKDEKQHEDPVELSNIRPKYVRVDMAKLRDRWWDLLRRKRQTMLAQQADDDESTSSSSDSSESSWDESPVELVVSISAVVDPTTSFTWEQSSSYPLHQAIIDNDEDAVRAALRHGEAAWVETFVQPSQLGIAEMQGLCGSSSLSPLLLAVCLDKPNFIKLLYDASPPTALCDSKGRTALMIATELSFEGCIRALLACGASLLDKDKIDCDTALHYACRVGGPPSVLRTLLSKLSGGNLIKILCCKNKFGQTPLHTACAHGHVHLVEVFLSVCSDSVLSKLLRSQDDRKQTALLTAVKAESTDVVMSLLMWRGNHYQAVDSSDESCPLSAAVSVGSIDMVMLLLEFMDPNQGGYDLDAALQEAVRSRLDSRLQIIRVLVQTGANISASPKEVDSSSTAVSIACAKGDVQGLNVMLDTVDGYMTEKRIARRQDPKLRRQPESYFRAIESKQDLELKGALVSALLQSLFLSFMDGETSTSRLDTCLCLLRRGVQLKSCDFWMLKESIVAKRLVSQTETSFEDGGHWFASCYNHFGSPESPNVRVSAYDRSSLGYWSHRLLSLPWMKRNGSDVHCSWMMVNRGRMSDLIPLSSSDPIVLVSQTEERFVVDASIVSEKSAKLAAAIRFECMNQDSSSGLPEIRLGISSHQCKWLLQHMYHGSIVNGWDQDLNKCALDLLECAVIAEEFLCPSLLKECEMRLLSANPFQCFCWSCCFEVQGTSSIDRSLPVAECLNRVRGPSRLLTAACALDALAIAQQLEGLSLNDKDSSIRWCARGQGAMPRRRASFMIGDWSRGTSFAFVKDSAIEVVLKDFARIVQSDAFRSQVQDMISDQEADETTNQDQQAQAILLQTCLNELESSPLVKRRKQSQANFPAQKTESSGSKDW